MRRTYSNFPLIPPSLTLLNRHRSTPLPSPHLRPHQLWVLPLLGQSSSPSPRRSLIPTQQNNATPLILVRDAYEAIVLTAFFYLLLVYLSPDPEEQKRIFLKAGLSKANDQVNRQRGEKLQRWVWPLGFIKKKPKVLAPFRFPCSKTQVWL